MGCKRRDNPSYYYFVSWAQLDWVRLGPWYDLNQLIPPSSEVYLSQAIAINDLGWILCYGQYRGIYRSFLLVPAEPAGVGNAQEYR